MSRLRYVTFAVFVSVVLAAERQGVLALGPLEDWEAYGIATCDAAFDGMSGHIANESIYGAGQCACQGSAPSECYDEAESIACTGLSFGIDHCNTRFCGPQPVGNACGPAEAGAWFNFQCYACATSTETDQSTAPDVEIA